MYVYMYICSIHTVADTYSTYCEQCVSQHPPNFMEDRGVKMSEVAFALVKTWILNPAPALSRTNSL